MPKITHIAVVVLLALGLDRPSVAQTFPFTSGPIPLCDTSTFTANVSGVGWLVYPDGWNWGPYLENVLVNITTDHPQTLQISLTSPEGTTLLLSEFNGAGGQNYTNTNFGFWGWSDITTAAAPFSGSYYPQGGSLDVFTNENADGVWTITVIDTACVNGGTGPGGTWTPGWFSGGAGSGAFAFGFSSPPPPCEIYMGSGSATICAGGSADILALFESQYGWLAWDVWGPDWNIVLDPYAVTEEGYYQIYGYDGFCSYYGDYEITLGSVVDLGPDQSVTECSSSGGVDVTALFPPPGANTYSWSLDGSPISSATAAAATVPGLYELISTNAGWCYDTALVTLSFTPGVTIGPDQAVSICPGGSVDLTTLYATAGLSEEWTFGGAMVADPTAAVDAGVYTLVVTTVDGCTDTAEVALDVQAMTSLGPDQTHDLCDNETIDLTTLYATTGFTVSWTSGGLPVADPTTIGEAGTYQLVASNSTGCSDTAVVSINVLVSPVLGPDEADAACAGDLVDLTGYYITTGLATSWSSNGMAVPDPTAVSATGVYVLVATAVNGCADTAQVDLTVSANPVLGADLSVTECDGTAVDLTILYTTGANATAWALNGDPVPDPASVTVGGSYTLTATNAAGCTANAQVTLTLDPAPALGTDQSASICVGSSFDLTSTFSTTGLTVEWTLGGIAVADPSAVTVAGNYQLVVTNAAACTDTAVVALSVNTGPSLGTDLMFALCSWQTVDLTAVFPVAGLAATYELDGLAVSDPTAVSDEGVYLVTVTDANGCVDEAEATVTAIECLCEAEFTENARCMQDPVQFILLADSMILGAHWDLNGAADNSTQIDPLVSFTSEGDVRVTLEAMLSCGLVRVERTIRIEDCSDSCSVWIPSAFTPDNDGRNDTWTWSGECRTENFSVEVYDRWGELVFASNDPMGSWDGSYRGVKSPAGVYAYRAGYRLPYQKRKEVTGSITLVR